MYRLTFLLMFCFFNYFLLAQVNINVGDNFQTVINNNPAGTTFIIKAGEHRLQTIVARNGDAFLGELDAYGNRLTILKGSKIIAGFTKLSGANGDYWKFNGTVEDNFIYDLGTCETGFNCHRAEDVFVNGLPLLKVNDLALLDEENECYFDGPDLYIKTNPTNKLIEQSVNKFAVKAKSAAANSGINAASNVTVKNLIVEQYANPAQHGAIHAGGNNQVHVKEQMGTNWLVENNEVRNTHGTGIFVYSNGVMKDNLIYKNGQIGMKASGSDVIITGNEVYENCEWGGYKWSWEGGASKFAHTTNIHLINNYCYNNNGPGLWTDIDNKNALIENNRCENNNGSGIFHEISYSAIIRCNTSANNGYTYANGQWYGGNIFISNSSDVEVYNNTVVCSGGDRSNGIVLMCDDRFNSNNEPYFTRNNHIYDNDITFMAAANITGLVRNTPDCSDYSGNVYERNTYHTATPGHDYFNWGGYTTADRGDFTWFKNVPQDAGSTLDGNVNSNPVYAACSQTVNQCVKPVNSEIETDDGDIYVGGSCNGVILESPGGLCFRIAVNDQGLLTTSSVICPNTN